MTNTHSQSVVQYGVQTPASKTVLLLTDRLEEAENILDVVGEGRILQRTVEYGPWRPATLPKTSAHAEAS
jgi:hypothetical protein